MTGLDIFALIVLFILLLTSVAIWVALAALPGQIAKKRNHPQAEAVNLGGWLGALLGGVFWPIVLVWAFIKPQSGHGENNVDKAYSIDKEEFEVIKNKLTALEARADER